MELVRSADLEVTDPAFFRDLLKAVMKATGDQVDFILDPEGITVQQMDPSYVCMVHAFIPRDFFSTYNVYENRTISLDVDAYCKQVFRTGKMKECLGILMRIEADRIVSDITDRGRRVTKNTPLLDPLEKEVPTPNIFFNSSARLVTKTLKGVLEDCKSIKSEHVLITVEPDKLLFTCEDQEKKFLVESIFNKYADDILNLEAGSTQKAIYDVDFLLDLIKGLGPISETVELEISNDMPICISAETPVYGVKLIYYLAPCIDYRDKTPKPKVEAAALEADTVDVDVIDPHEDPAEVPPEDPPVEYPTFAEAVFGMQEDPLEIPAVEADPVDYEDPGAVGRVLRWLPAEVPHEVPHEDQLSPGELYLKYYAEALARHTAEAA